jgi:hypothetical protein
MTRAIAVAGALTLSTGTAQAAVIQYTYAGVVDYGYDRAGIFGTDQSLTGDPFTLVERFNTDTAAFRYVDAAQSLQYGGSQRGTPNSASLTITIGGASRSIADLEDYIYSGSATGKHLDFVKDATGYEYAGFYVSSPQMPAHYGTAVSLTAAQATFIGNYQYFSQTDPSLATYASFDVHTLDVGSISAVPLPSSLSLFGSTLLIVAAAARLPRRQHANGRKKVRR